MTKFTFFGDLFLKCLLDIYQGELYKTFMPAITIISNSCDSCECLQAGDTVGVVRKEDGSLHFFVNGVPQGPAAWNVPSSVYAVVDLYGQAAQATIMDDMGESNKNGVEMIGW